jgi:hypothetical protein
LEITRYVTSIVTSYMLILLDIEHIWIGAMGSSMVVDEMPKMKGGNSKRGKKKPKTEWDKVKNFIGYGKIVSIIERS